MSKKKILIVVGTRPNFIKVTQFKTVASDYPNLDFKIVHTGQHYDKSMSDIFFKQFDLIPDYFLEADNTGVIDQLTSIMLKLQDLILTQYRPDLIIVPGDVNSTLAAAIVANKLNIKLAHLESGLRSFDKSMPEEHNRILTDNLSNYLFVTEPSGLDNIKNENIKGEFFYVGNTMIDSMVSYSSFIEQSTIKDKLNITSDFVLLTMHRPSNVDSEKGIKKLVTLLIEISKKYQVIFPIHPRTLKKIKEYNLYTKIQKPEIILSDALGYFEFQHLVSTCKFILTDSGGIQEEATYKLVPCLTIRNNTERPITITEGTNTLVNFEIDDILAKIDDIEKGVYKKGKIPNLWDGKTTDRIVKIISGTIFKNEK